MVVVDASALAAILFDEASGPAMAARLEGEELHAPGLLFFELTNIARTKARQRPAQTAALQDSLDDGLAYPVVIDAVDYVAVLRLARQTGLSAYDASYLWLSRHFRAPLVTLDSKLASHAKSS